MPRSSSHSRLGSFSSSVAGGRDLSFSYGQESITSEQFSFAASVPLPQSRRPSIASSYRPSFPQDDGQPADIPARKGPYKLLTSFKIEASEIRVAKWVSEESGLSVVWVDKPGPIIKGFVQVRTEIFNDSGVPHTLEHLTFCGSEKYPYNGVLDKLGNRCLASGTNAWTENLATVYTSELASEEGFLNILPVYLDHICYPSLKEEAFTTEVYNINGEGQDGGVVFSEMQGCADDVGSLIELKRQRTLYNKDNANRSETGGLMENLRKLKIESIDKFHAEAYVPQNMTLLVIGGAVSPSNLLSVLTKKVEPSFASHHQNLGPHPSGWKRPWIDSLTPHNPPILNKNIVEKVPYPSKDESDGMISIHWIGPPPTDLLMAAALSVLGQYLSDTSVSPLSKEFVEIKEPYCTGIGFDTSPANPTILGVTFVSVPKKDLKILPKLFFDKLAKIAKDGFDMKRIGEMIHKNRLAVLDDSETGSASWISGNVLSDHLWGPEDGSGLKDTFGDLQYCRTLSRWAPEQWVELLETWYLDPHSLTLIGTPSAPLVDELAADVEALVKSREKKFGKDGLARFAKKISDAKKVNDEPVPPELLRSFKMPDLKGIKWIKVDEAYAPGVTADIVGEVPQNDLQNYIEDRDREEFPLYLQFGDYESSFVEINVCLFADTLPSNLDAHLRELIPLYVATFGNLPVVRANGERLSHEEAVRQLESDTLNYGVVGGAPLSESLVVSMKVVKEKYEVGIEWLKDLLWGTQFEVERLLIAATQSVQDLPSSEEDGNTISSAGLGHMFQGSHSNARAGNLLTAFRSAPQILSRIKQEPDAVVDELEALRRALTDPRAMRISVTGNVRSLSTPVGSWINKFEPIQSLSADQLIPPVMSIDVLTPLGHKPAFMLDVYTVPAIASTFGHFASRGPHDWKDPDLPALSLALQMLNADEGPLWNSVRGAGLAYGAGVGLDLESGLLTFTLFKSPNAAKAWLAARESINAILSGGGGASGLTALDLEAAKSGHAFGVAQIQATKSSAAWWSFINKALFERPSDYSRLSLAKTQNVKFDDILRVLSKYIKPIFEPRTSIGCVATSPASAKNVAESFRSIGFKVTAQTLPKLTK